MMYLNTINRRVMGLKIKITTDDGDVLTENEKYLPLYSRTHVIIIIILYIVCCVV